jgi:hypothetical protein
MGIQLHNMSGAVSASSLTVAGVAISPASLFSVPADHDLIAWSAPIPVQPNATALAPAGTLAGYRIRRVPATTLTGLVIMVTTAGSTLTSGQCFGAAFNASTKALIDQTTDQATAWASTGVKLMPFAAGPVSWPGGDIDGGVWFQGTTGPTLARAGINPAFNNANLSAPNFEVWIANTGLTTAAPGTLGTQSSASNSMWIAVY